MAVIFSSSSGVVDESLQQQPNSGNRVLDVLWGHGVQQDEVRVRLGLVLGHEPGGGAVNGRKGTRYRGNRARSACCRS